jgi:hypothetical protein
MKTPRLFSPAITRRLIPEKLGQSFQGHAVPLAGKIGNRCEITKFPYPLYEENGKQKTWLMMESREELTSTKAGSSKPLLKDAGTMAEEIQKLGVTNQTVKMVCPLYFWSRHADLAIEFRKGSLVFAPWISQAELLHLFRGLMVAAQQKGLPSETEAQQTLQKLGLVIGNGSVLAEVTGYPENVEWSSLGWLKAVRNLPSRERRVYLKKFAANLRFWPSAEVFKPLGPYWAEIAKPKESSAQADMGNPWVSHYRDMLAKIQSDPSKNHISPKLKKTAPKA